MNIIKVNVNFKNRTNSQQGVALTEGDYNSTKMVFTFDTEEGTKVLEMKNPSDEIVLHKEIINNEVVLVGEADVTTKLEDVTYTKYVDENQTVYWYDSESEKLYDDEFTEVQNVDIDDLTKVTTEASIFNEVGNYTYEVILYNANGKLTSKSDYIKIKKKQVDTDGQSAVIFKPVFDEMYNELLLGIEQCDNLDLDVSKSGTVTTVTITKKDGTEESAEINDGEIYDDTELRTLISLKQDTLVSGTNIKTINNETLLGDGNITITGSGTATDVQINGTSITKEGLADIKTNTAYNQSSNKIATMNDIPDISGKQNITDNTLTTTNKTVPTAINEVNSIAKGANQAVSYSNYSAMVTAFNGLDDDVYNVGQNVMIVTLEVPDLWISGIESTSSTYTYVDDATIVNELQTNGYIQVGYYKLSMLETQKVDLTGYQEKIDSSHKLSSDLVDDTNKTNKFVTSAEKSTWNGKYDKPSGGIPSTDLTSAVQTSLGKADTAIQDISGKQDVLVSGKNIKKVNYVSLLDEGNFNIFDDLQAKNGITFEKDYKWVKAEDKGLGSQWYGIAYGNGKYVALASSGKVSVSNDGINWGVVTTLSELGSNNWHGITYGNGKFVALSFTGYISTSTDGATWTTATLNSNLGGKNWQNIAYGNNLYVAIGSNGYVSYSSDGTTWANASYKSAVGQHSYYALTYGNGKFVAVGYGGWITSTEDGATWTTATENSNLGSNSWILVQYAEGKYYAVGSAGHTSTSTDGTTWSLAAENENLGDRTWRRACFDGKTIIALSSSGYMSYGRPIYKIKTSDTKVTSISSASTDNQYPSAKCVYDLIGDVESLLSEV